ncbi:MAG: hypothetical protein ACR2GE_06430 [Pseudonocardia sp.]
MVTGLSDAGLGVAVTLAVHAPVNTTHALNAAAHPAAMLCRTA